MLLFKPNSDKKSLKNMEMGLLTCVCVCVQHEEWLILITSPCPYVINIRLSLSLHPIHFVLSSIYPVSGFCELGNRKVRSWRWSHRLVTWKREYVVMCTYCCNTVSHTNAVPRYMASFETDHRCCSYAMTLGSQKWQ
jgi:hypothetical protein